MIRKPPDNVRHADPLLDQLFDALWADKRSAEAIARKAGIDGLNLRNFMTGRTRTMPIMSVVYLVPVVLPGRILAIAPDPAKAKHNV